MRKLLILLLMPFTLYAARDRYVVVGGAGVRDGTSWADAWTIQTAAAAAIAGDIVWLQAGNYNMAGGLAGLTITAKGSATGGPWPGGINPVIYRAYQPSGTERIIWDGGNVGSSGGQTEHFTAFIPGPNQNPSAGYVWLWGIEVAHTNAAITVRLDTDADPTHPACATCDYPSGILWQDDQGTLPGIKYINCIFHDIQTNLLVSNDHQNWEIYGCAVWNLGFQGSDRGHGHEWYTQNVQAHGYIDNTITLAGFDAQVHSFGQGGSEITIRKSTFAYAGEIRTLGGGRALLYTQGSSGDATQTNDSLYDNFIYKSSSANIELGGCCVPTPATLNFYLKRNIVVGGTGVLIAGGTHPGFNMNNNKFVGATLSGVSAGAQDTVTTNPPALGPSTDIKLWKNKYEGYMANLTIGNWGLADSVTVNVSTLDSSSGGTAYAHVRSWQNFFGDAEHVYLVDGSGNIKIPMMTTRWSRNTVPGWSVLPPAITKQFGVFRVRMSGGIGTPPDTLSQIASYSTSAITQNTARLKCTIDNSGSIQGSVVTYEWGLTTSYGTSAPGVPATITGTAVTADSCNISGLIADTLYHWRPLATNGAGTQTGSDNTFRTSAAVLNPPIIIVDSLRKNTTGTTATGYFRVNNQGVGGGSVTKVRKGTAPNTYVDSTTASLSPVTGTGLVKDSILFTGLTPNQAYYWQVFATSSDGTTTSPENSYTTPAIAPTVVTGGAYNVDRTTAMVWATVNPNNSSTTAYMLFGDSAVVAVSGFLDSVNLIPGVVPAEVINFQTQLGRGSGFLEESLPFEESNPFTNSPPVFLTGTSMLQVIAPLTGLTQSTKYAIKAVGYNSGGRTADATLYFKTLQSGARLLIH